MNTLEFDVLMNHTHSMIAIVPMANTCMIYIRLLQLKTNLAAKINR